MSRPSQTYLANRLRQLSLNSPSQTALFYARFFNALCPSENDHESAHILALCLLEVGEAYSALHVVRARAGSGCRACAMLVARCSQTLGRFSEGQAVLEYTLRHGFGSTVLPTLNTSTSAHLALAQLSHKGKANEVAMENYQRALLDDPWLWEAFTGLCDLGVPPAPEQLFPDPPAISRASSSRQSRPPTLSPNPMPRSSASEMPGFLPTRKQLSPLMNGGGAGFFTPDVAPSASRLGVTGSTTWETPLSAGDTTFPTIGEGSVRPHSRRQLPSLISSLLPTTSSMIPSSLRPTATSTPVNDIAPPSKPPAMKRPRAGNNNIRKTLDQPQNGLPIRANGRDLKSIEPNGEADAPVRRSTRLKSGPTIATHKAASKTREHRVQRSRSATSSGSVEMTSPQSQEDQLQLQADDWLRNIVRRCARIHRSLCIHAHRDAVAERLGLPEEIKECSWGLEVIARATYEMANYTISRRAFERIRQLEPYRLEQMELFSTVLWHLQDAPALSHLSQFLMTISREAPQTWISAGNLFSLQKDHDQAMRCFKRATQIEPGCSYAWTLCGHEAIEMEEYDRATAYFRTAIRTDPRHYNAWYGMGLVYYHKSKLRHAEHHFRRAADINPTNAALLSSIGEVLEQSDDITQAHEYYLMALKYAPTSAGVRYKAIRALVAMQRIDEAIDQLVPLSREAPDEAQVFFLLGKCLLRKDRGPEAQVAFTAARDLQPKLAAAIDIAEAHNGESEEEEEDE